MSDLSVVLKNVVILNALSDGDLLRHWYQVFKVLVWDVVHLLRMDCTSSSVTQTIRMKNVRHLGIISA
jgi:hypothetical protein